MAIGAAVLLLGAGVPRAVKESVRGYLKAASLQVDEFLFPPGRLL